ncbi:hypothetical protein HDU81_011084, partial [Chytriomyces hyalinus]
MSNQQLLNELLVVDEEETASQLMFAARRNAMIVEETASRLMFAAKRKAIIEKLCAGGECDAQAGNLEGAPVPAAVPETTVVESISNECQKVDTVECVSRRESEVTLMGDEISVENDDPVATTTTELGGKESTTESTPQLSQYLYCLYTDPLAIAAECPWFMDQQPVIDGSDHAIECAESDICSTTFDTTYGLNEQATANAPDVDGEIVAPEISGIDEHFQYSMYVDAAVISAEVSWCKSLEALALCSGYQLELVVADQQPDGQESLSVVTASKGTSISSGSSTRTNKRK